MKRETRANLIFLSLFLGISVPGVAILVKKKMDPMAKRMAMPDSALRRLPYMTPLQTPDEVSRYVPPLTGQWVKMVGREQGGIDNVLSRKWQPIVSDDHLIQAMGVRPEPGGATVLLLVWGGEYGADAARYTVQAAAGDKTPASKVVLTRPLAMPADVRKELMTSGYFRPPHDALWLEVSIADPAAVGKPLTLRLSYQGTSAPPTSLDVSVAADFAQK